MATAEVFTGEKSFENRYLPFRYQGEWVIVSERQLVHVAEHCARVGQLVEVLFPNKPELILAAYNHDWGKCLVPEQIYFGGKYDRDVVTYYFKNHDVDTLKLLKDSGVEESWVRAHPLASYFIGTHHQSTLRPLVRMWLQKEVGFNTLRKIEAEPQYFIDSNLLFISDHLLAGLEKGRPDREKPKEKVVLVAQIKEEVWHQSPNGVPLELVCFDYDKAYEAAREITQATHLEGKDLFYWLHRLPYSMTSSLFYLAEQRMPRVSVGAALLKAFQETSLRI